MMDFVSFARCHGVEIPALESGYRINRCPTTAHPRSDNGAYFFDGRRGWVQNWETGEPVQWWNDESKPWTETDKAQWLQVNRLNSQDRQRRHAEAAKKAQETILLARQDEHPYLIEKGLGGVKGLVFEDALLVPMRDVGANKLLGLQSITLVDNRWQKKMSYGMRAKGAVFRIGNPRAMETWLVEGYATGLSVDAALHVVRVSACVLVCFSANNLEHVAGQLKGRRLIYADSDQSGVGEKTAQATGLPYCMSDVVGNDANDDHNQFGVFAVAKKLQEARQQ